jgi:hypothetical protein
MLTNIHSDITQCVNSGAVLCVTVGCDVRHKIRNQLRKVKTLSEMRGIVSAEVTPQAGCGNIPRLTTQGREEDEP